MHADAVAALLRKGNSSDVLAESFDDRSQTKPEGPFHLVYNLDGPDDDATYFVGADWEKLAAANLKPSTAFVLAESLSNVPDDA